MAYEKSPSNTLPQTPASGPRSVKRPSDPLKDGSIFHMGSHSFRSRPPTDTRFPYAQSYAYHKCDSAHPSVSEVTHDKAAEGKIGIEKQSLLIL